MSSAASSGDGTQPPNASPAAFDLRTIGPEPDGATPIDDDDLADLIPDFVATRRDLNVVEYENIAKAMPWARAQARRGGFRLVLSYSFIIELHKRMFEDVWKWAGTQRRRGTNIGVDPAQITTQTKQTLDDAVWWHENETFTADERAARIHRRLVAVHPFRNGNGRCTRLVADLYLVSIELPAFTWGAGGRVDEDSDARHVYLSALHAADGGDYEPLVMFARS
jgi:Fic-DOC domain mobile mystery protein B